ncbi:MULTISPECIES: cell division protein FtsL [Pacificibacter]|uniref:cell division protein FtsL n=1 Tax=Pacificibacter TaxID=1042323 RepID=UPI001C084DC0|nr:MULTISPECIES: cell division protein FtsL [Pacificibacter]MBU2935377.1 cell division protein FtsL [Pacificibacter marinus]MDO6615532.1 cell division protein FtsL [Pacificibacter sp. 1_MG-2023]
MRSVYIVLSALFVMGLAVWAYKENYATQEVLREVSQIQRDIGHQQEELAVLRAEWAYLNRPSRLRDLAELNFDRLGLLPLLPEQFGDVTSVAFPVEEDILMELDNPVSVVGSLEAIVQ